MCYTDMEKHVKIATFMTSCGVAVRRQPHAGIRGRAPPIGGGVGGRGEGGGGGGGCGGSGGCESVGGEDGVPVALVAQSRKLLP